MNSWDGRKVRDALAGNGRKKTVVSGLWTGVCNNTFVGGQCRLRKGIHSIFPVLQDHGIPYHVGVTGGQCRPVSSRVCVGPGAPDCVPRAPGVLPIQYDQKEPA